MRVKLLPSISIYANYIQHCATHIELKKKKKGKKVCALRMLSEPNQTKEKPTPKLSMANA